MAAETSNPTGGQNILSLGFGTVNPNAIIDIGLPAVGGRGFLGAVVLANTPQVILSFLYLMHNALYTCMHLGYEYSGYAVHRKPLRVTTPRGEQRSTYWLQLPYTYGVPLILASATLHWLVSQSIFLTRVSVWSHEVEVEDSGVSAVGFSCAPIACLFALGGILVLLSILTGLRKLQSHMPIAGSNSSILAAAAHRPEQDVDAAILPVKWGVVARANDDGIGHCSFNERRSDGIAGREAVCWTSETEKSCRAQDCALNSYLNFFATLLRNEHERRDQW